MIMPVVHLSHLTAKLLTSTQVITSVSSVVKELVENALDAGACSIEIRLINYGLDRIEVQDDGHGVPTPDVGLIFQPHTTSKIAEFSDLTKLETYGFRGEALSSLCNVADITITTRTSSDEYASVFSIDKNGKIIDVKPSHFAKGSTIVVCNLFHNLPVRKQHMKSSNRLKAELKKTESIVKNLAIINSCVRFTFCHNKCLLWQKLPATTLKESALSVLGYTIACQLEEISSVLQQNTVTLLLPKKYCKDFTAICFPTVDVLRIFINCRPVRYKKLEKIIVNNVNQYFGCSHLQGKYPSCVVSITVPPSDIDVNIEPNKSQVLCQDEDGLLTFVEKLIASYYQPINQQAKKPRLDEQPAKDKLAHDDCFEDFDFTTPQAEIDYPVILIDKDKSSHCTNSKNNTENMLKTSNDLWKSADEAMGLWSRGWVKSGNGDVIEGAATIMSTTRSALDKDSLSKTKSKSISVTKSSKTMKISAKNTHLLDTSYHSVCSQMGRKELESFTKFSREIRSKIISENPGIPFTNVASILAQKWKELPPEEQKSYNNNEMKKCLPEKCQNPILFTAHETTCNKKSAILDASMEQIRSFKNAINRKKQPSHEIELIGQLVPQGVWLYRYLNEIGILRHWALHEKIVYRQLIREHCVPMVPLDVPIALREEDFDLELWHILVSMESEKTYDNTHNITSPLIVKNGFKIERSSEYIHMTEVASTIRFYGIDDLKEVLRLSQRFSDLECCRPVKVLAYLESEAVRITRQAPTVMTEQQLEKLLRCFNSHENLCLHHKPIFETLYSLT